MMALCLAREDAVEGWREMLGPKEIQVAADQAPDRCSDGYTYTCTVYSLLRQLVNLFTTLYMN